jgi:hypothetical protein
MLRSALHDGAFALRLKAALRYVATRFQFPVPQHREGGKVVALSVKACLWASKRIKHFNGLISNEW